VIIIKRKYIRLAERLFIVICVIAVTAVIVKAADRRITAGKGDNKNNNGCPNDMVFVTFPGGGFCIDKYEESAGSGCPNSDPSNQTDTFANIDSSGCKPVSAAGSKAWRNISQNQAALACAKAGKRLPNGKEWLAAALGTPDKATGWNGDDCQVNKNWTGQPGYAGQGINCVSAAGAYDMIGNVWEWIDGTISDGLYQGRKLPEDGYIISVDGDGLPAETNTGNPDQAHYNDFFWVEKSGVRAVARGGYWDNKSDAGQYAVYAVSSLNYYGDGVGFRCAK
jgi:formylglycine-generating enzyme required for sulfatase activity